MNNIQTNLKNEDGSIETLLITSNDNYVLNMNKTYKLANRTQKKENKLVNSFKNSIFGSDIGIKSSGFSHIAILSTLIAVGTICGMYLLWRL